MKLSIITSGKNDNYAGNFIQRLQHNLIKLDDNINKLNTNDIEVIVVDWGSEEKISDVLSNINFKHINFLYVPEDIGKQYSPDSNFSIVHSLNAGFRRSKGDYIFFIDGDSYVPFNSLKTIFDLVKDKNENIFYWASRYHLPYNIHSQTSNINDIDREIDVWEQNHKQSWKHDKINLSRFDGRAMGLLLSRNICDESSCFYEKLNKWGWLDIEIHNRIISKYKCWGDLEDLNIAFFHLDHHSVASMGQNGMNDAHNSHLFTSNDSSWGLINENLTLYKNK
jgi:glycosyltransferase involved in cell wall biosynthesis